MTTQLSDIRTREVSLVRRGANKRRFLLAKADTGDVDRELVTILAAPAEGEAELLEAVRKSGGDETVEKAAVAVARVVGALKGAYGDDGIPAEVLKAMGGGDTPDDGDEIECEDDEDVELAKADVAAGDEIFKADFTAEQRQKMAGKGEAMGDGSYPIPNRDFLQRAIRAVGRGKGDHAEIRKHIAERARALGATDLLPDSWDVKKEDTTMTETTAVPIKKDDGTWDLSGVPEEQRPALELVLKSHGDELAELRKQHEESESKAIEKAENAEKIAKAEQETRERREYLAKSEALTKLAKEDAELGAVLYEIAKAEEAGHLTEGTLDKLDGILKAADEQVSKGDLFTEMGRTGGVGGGDAQAKLDAAAADIRKNDSSLTREQAVAKALEDNPELYTEIRKENA